MFGHLQIYSAYSFQQSTISISSLVKQAKILGLDYLALTDHHQMYGMMEFMHACTKNQIKPIFGLEATVNYLDSIFPVILLAKDTDGYFGLVKISSLLQLSENESVDFSELLK